jgi:hypothetical protein
MMRGRQNHIDLIVGMSVSGGSPSQLPTKLPDEVAGEVR